MLYKLVINKSRDYRPRSEHQTRSKSDQTPNHQHAQNPRTRDTKAKRRIQKGGKGGRRGTKMKGTGSLEDTIVRETKESELLEWTFARNDGHRVYRETE